MQSSDNTNFTSLLHYCIDCFEEKTVDWAHQHEVVTLKSCEHTTKYITGYGTGFGYVINGEVCNYYY